jgi:hypothetical protein
VNRISTSSANPSGALNLRAGDWAEVRSQEEILGTLDERGCLENLPFMPEMFQYCGQKLRVYKRADKTCEYTQQWSIRRMKDSVHLEGARCDGSGHSGCEASCLIFWKEAWLKRADSNVVSAGSLRPTATPRPRTSGLCTVESILAASRMTNAEGETIYSCQATTVPNFTSYMSFWDPRQYIRDLRSGNLDSGLARNTRGQRMLDMILAVLRLVQASIIGLYNELQEKRKGTRYPFIEGTAEKSPLMLLNLQPGELVQVRNKDEIMGTLDKGQKNRGLWFDSEMLPYCGGIYRVLRRVHSIIDEKTGKLITMKNPCIVLEGVICKSDYHRLCPRAIYPYWREAWLLRASVTPSQLSAESAAETCEQSSRK